MGTGSHRGRSYRAWPRRFRAQGQGGNSGAEVDTKLEQSGLADGEYDKRGDGYRIRLGIDELNNRIDALRELVGMAHSSRAFR